MEASALPASVGLARARLGIGIPLLRLRSDEQLVSLFRAGNEEAFRVIHDRYRQRLLAYTRQMLSASPADAEDAVQEIFVRAYAGLRSNGRDLALRAWLYRIAHNRSIDELRRSHAIPVEAVEELGEASGADPQAQVEQREALRRLIADVQRLPEQQRSALLMRELGGMPYADLSGALGVSVPAVKSLLVRARVGLAQASEARDTACASIREDLIVAHDRGVRASGLARRHLRDCSQCRQFRTEVHGVSRNLGLLLPALGPIGVVAKLIGFGGLGFGGLSGGSGAAAGSSAGAAAAGTGAAAGSSAVASTSAVAGGGAALAGGGALAGSGVLASAGAVAGAGHVVTIIAATVVAAGGAIGIQQEVSARPVHHAHHRRVAAPVASRPTPTAAPETMAAAVTPAAMAAAPHRTVAPPVVSPKPTMSPAAPTHTAAVTLTPTRARRVHAATPRTALRSPDDAGYPVQTPVSGEPVTTLPVTTSPPPTPLPVTTTTSTTPTTTASGTTTTTTDPTAPTTTTPGSTTPAPTVPGTTTTPVSGTPTTTPITSTGTSTSAPTPTGPTTPTHNPDPVILAGPAPTVTPASSGAAGASTKARAKTRLIVRHAGSAASATVR